MVAQRGHRHQNLMQTENQIQTTVASALSSLLPTKEKKLLKFSDGGNWREKWLKLKLHHRKLVDLAGAAQSFAERFFSNWKDDSLFVISGPTGVGKTHVCDGLYRWATHVRLHLPARGAWPAHELPSITWVPWPKAVNLINETRTEFLQDVERSSLLVLDDIGAENDPWKKGADRLCQILSHREREFTIVTTNIEPYLWSEKYDVRIADRLVRNSVIVNLEGVPSYATI